MKRILLARAFSLAAIIIGAIFRACALFYLEAGAVNPKFKFPSWTHEGGGNN